MNAAEKDSINLAIGQLSLTLQQLEQSAKDLRYGASHSTHDDVAARLDKYTDRKRPSAGQLNLVTLGIDL